MCKTILEYIKMARQTCRPAQTSPKNITGAFGLKMRIWWCINMWEMIKIWETYQTTSWAPFMCKTSRNRFKWLSLDRPRCAGVPSCANKMVLESLFNESVKSYLIFIYLCTIGIGFFSIWIQWYYLHCDWMMSDYVISKTMMIVTITIIYQKQK